MEIIRQNMVSCHWWSHKGVPFFTPKSWSFRVLNHSLKKALIVLTHTNMNLPKRGPKVHFFDLVLNQGFWEHLSCAGDSSTIIVGWPCKMRRQPVWTTKNGGNSSTKQNRRENLSEVLTAITTYNHGFFPQSYCTVSSWKMVSLSNVATFLGFHVKFRRRSWQYSKWLETFFGI